MQGSSKSRSKNFSPSSTWAFFRRITMGVPLLHSKFPLGGLYHIPP